MSYVIKRTDQGGGWVTPAGSAASYTHRLQDARTFSTKEAAEHERCPENEVVLVREILEMQKPSDQEGFGVCVPLDKGDQEREKSTT